MRVIITLLTALILVSISISEAQVNTTNIEPQHEYEKPGFSSGHAFDALNAGDRIDLLSGALVISQRDTREKLPGPEDRFFNLITRTYSSKIYRQQISGTCGPMGLRMEDRTYTLGLGWTMHIGRLWDDQTGPVLELPDGSRHVFVPDSNAPPEYPLQRISKSGWILRNDGQPDPSFIAISPGPDAIELRFREAERHEQLDRTVINIDDIGLEDESSTFGFGTAYDYANYNECVLPPVPEDWPVGGWFLSAIYAGEFIIHFPFDWTWCYSPPDPPYVEYADSQQLHMEYEFSEPDQLPNTPILLERFTTPEGKTYQYQYDPITYELTKIVLSSDPVIDENADLVIEYVYENHIFPTSRPGLLQSCSRVVTQRKVKRPGGGGYDVWTYSYPSSLPHKVTVTDPLGNRREVTFSGYEPGNTWKVGQILLEETFSNTGVLLKSQSYNYAGVQLSNVLDPDGDGFETLKIPVLLDTTLSYPQNSKEHKTVYALSGSEYDRFGNSPYKKEYLNGQLIRTTEYDYAHEDPINGSSFLLKNVVHAPTRVEAFDGQGPSVSRIRYEYYTNLNSSNFGMVKDKFVWNDETSSEIRTSYQYDQFRQVNHISEETETSEDRETELTPGNNTPTRIAEVSLQSVAGYQLDATVDQKWRYNTIQSPNGNATSYAYDDDDRLTSITPPSSDSINITYDDQNRKATQIQGDSQTVELYDERGRIRKRAVTISTQAPVSFSYQIFGYDALDRQTCISEMLANDPGSTPCESFSHTQKAYDALDRITSIVTPDGSTTYGYNGTDVTMTVNSEIGPIDTIYNYDALGRLLSVEEPTGTITEYEYDALDRLKSVFQPGAQARSFTYSSRGKLVSETHPESGTTNYKYDKLGRLTHKQIQELIPSDSWIQYRYDLRDRLLEINYPNQPGDPDTKYFYDGASSPTGFEEEEYTNAKSHLTSMIDETGATIWPDRSAREEILSRDIYFTSINDAVSLSYTYDSRGNLSTIQYASGQIVKYLHNNANAIRKITRHFGTSPEVDVLGSVNYNPAVLPSNLSYGDGVFDLQISSDARNRPESYDSANRIQLNYNYNARGLIDGIAVSQFDPVSQGMPQLSNQPVEYDSLARVTSFGATDAVEYGYDARGNLLSKSGELTGSHTYNNKNQIVGVSYSGNGNQTNANGHGLVYRDDNLLRQVTAGGSNQSYFYDGSGRRVVSSGTTSTYFVYDESERLLSELKPDGNGNLSILREYIHGPTGTVATLRYDEAASGISAYNLTDRVRIYWEPFPGCNVAGVNVYRSLTSSGQPEKLTSCPNTSHFYDDVNVSSGTTYYYTLKTVYSDGTEGPASIQIAQAYSTNNPNAQGPYIDYSGPRAYYNINDHLGTTRIVADEDGDVTGSFEYYPFGELKEAKGCSASSQQFTGKLFDSESGLQYFGARYLSNDLTRFISVDPARESFNPRNPQSWNRYAYSLNDPLNLIDPDGREVTYATEALKNNIGVLLNRSADLRKALAGFEGKDNPNLHIQMGKVDTKKERGHLEAKINPTEFNREGLTLNESDAELYGNRTISAEFLEGTITIDENVSVNFKNKEFTAIFAHEAKHAEDALSDPTDFFKRGYTEAGMEHNERYYEKRANEFSRKVQEELKNK